MKINSAHHPSKEIENQRNNLEINENFLILLEIRKEELRKYIVDCENNFDHICDSDSYVILLAVEDIALHWIDMMEYSTLEKLVKINCNDSSWTEFIKYSKYFSKLNKELIENLRHLNYDAKPNYSECPSSFDENKDATGLNSKIGAVIVERTKIKIEKDLNALEKIKDFVFQTAADVKQKGEKFRGSIIDIKLQSLTVSFEKIKHRFTQKFENMEKNFKTESEIHSQLNQIEKWLTQTNEKLNEFPIKTKKAKYDQNSSVTNDKSLFLLFNSISKEVEEKCSHIAVIQSSLEFSKYNCNLYNQV